MNMNLIAAPISTPAPTSEGISTLSSTQRPGSPSDSRNSFSTVLRSVHQDDDGPARTQKRGDKPSPATNDADAREPRAKSTDRQSSQTQHSQTQSTDASADHAQDDQKAESSGSAPDDHDAHATQAGPDTASQGMLLALLQTPASETTTTPHDATPVQPTAVEAALTNVPSLATPNDHQATLGPVASTVGPLPSTDHATTMVASTADPVTPVETLPLSNQQAQQPTSRHGVPDDAQGQSNDEPQIEQIQPASIVVHEESNQQKAPALVIAKDAPLLQPTAVLTQSSQSQQDQTAEDITARLATNQSETAVHQIQEIREQQPVPSHPQTSAHDVLQKEEAAPKDAPALPHSWDAFSNLERQSDMQGSDRQGSRQDHTETPLPQGAAAPVLNQQSGGSAQPTAPFAVGNAIQPTPRSLDAHPASSGMPSQPIMASHDMSDAPMPAWSRSVAFEVAQPDLGRINVRVAMTNDLVHTHLSSDRSDVGNFLMNGQDRLQSALQASGLEMGQFRVHVDRQGTNQGGQEWLSRGYDDRSQQQRGQYRQQEQPTDSSRNDRQQLGVLSVFA